MYKGRERKRKTEYRARKEEEDGAVRGRREEDGVESERRRGRKIKSSADPPTDGENTQEVGT